MQKNGMIIFGCFSSLLGMGYIQNRAIKEKEFLDELKKDQDVELKDKILYKIHCSNKNYDKNHEVYEQSTKINEIRRILLKYVEGKVLETGVGTSRNIKFYENNNNISQIIGVDYSKEMLELSLKKDINQKIKYMLMDVEQLKFDNNQFDTVVDTFGLEFYQNPDMALKEMVRVLKNEGNLLLISSGLTDKFYMNLYLNFMNVYYIKKEGRFINREIDQLIQNNKDLELIEKKQFLNNKIKLYIIKKKQ